LKQTKLLTVRRRECHAVLHLAALHRHALELGLLLTFSPSLNLGTRELRTRKDLEVTARIQVLHAHLNHHSDAASQTAIRQVGELLRPV
jgi:hypothetical protein